MKKVLHTFYFNCQDIKSFSINEISKIYVFGDFNFWGQIYREDYELYPDISAFNKSLSGKYYRSVFINYGKSEFKYLIILKDGTNIWYPPGDNLKITTLKTNNKIKKGIFYQIFPDRFWREAESNRSEKVFLQQWGDTPTSYNYFGGNFKGITKQINDGYFNYLMSDTKLNITFYLNPINYSTSSNHRYWIEDYNMIDPLLGTWEDFKELVATIHKNAGRIIIDLVYNHCGISHYAFQDVLSLGKQSVFYNWFRKLPNFQNIKLNLPILEDIEKCKANNKFSPEKEKLIDEHLKNNHLILKSNRQNDPSDVEIVKFINDPRKENYNPHERSYFSLWNGRFTIPIKCYSQLNPVKYYNSYGFESTDLLREFDDLMNDLPKLLGVEYMAFILYLTQNVNYITFNLSEIIDNYSTKIFNFKANSKYLISEIKVIDIINHFLAEKNKQQICCFDIVNEIKERNYLPKITTIELLENYFKKPISEISDKDILEDQNYYTFVMSDSDLNYACWWNIFELPELNTKDKACREHLINSAIKLLDADVDGFRLDVPDNIKNYPYSDYDFWETFRTKCLDHWTSNLKKEPRDFFILGEIWNKNDAMTWFKHYDKGDKISLAKECDSIMNYSLRKAILNFTSLTTISSLNDIIEHYPSKYKPSDFDADINDLIMRFPKEGLDSLYNCLSSHDTRRLCALFQDAELLNQSFFPDIKNIEKNICVALILQFTLPGIPALYYGDEIGLTGLDDDGYSNANKLWYNRGTDPYCRGTFPFLKDTNFVDFLKDNPWHKYNRYLSFYRKLIQIRLKNIALQTGDFFKVYQNDVDGIYGFCRVHNNNKIFVLVGNKLDDDSYENVVIDLSYLTAHQINPGHQFVSLLESEIIQLDLKNNMHLNLKNYHGQIFLF